MPEIFDVSNWNEQPYFSTGGTREKSLLESPGGDSYYFKTSLLKPNKDYKFEFWSEIIASELGNSLGLNVLKYDVAIKGSNIGCISKSMIDQEKERLVEGVNYLTGYNNRYDPKSKLHQPLYSYQYIQEALKYFHLEVFLSNIDEIVVFDALIGNGDRHQENWGIISGHGPTIKKVKDVEVYQSDNYIRGRLKLLYNKFKPNVTSNSVSTIINVAADKIRFSPIYDSGSSLAREHSDEKIISMLKEKVQFDAYLNRGKSEIHWNGTKMRHFDLVTELLKTSEKAQKTIELFNSRFSMSSLENIIYNVDKNLPEEFDSVKLSSHRKDFLTKMITSRYQKLTTL